MANLSELSDQLKSIASTLSDTAELSDGHHTFKELYEYRTLLHAHAVYGWVADGVDVVKSWKHSDGERCFGGGWFIVTAEAAPDVV